MVTPPLPEARELLYEAYNDLQALAAELGGAAAPALAVVVVGHQTDGKSALVEALMGFQFNHVVGGTKTRRSPELHLRFNPRWDEPQCGLLAGPVDGADGDDEAGVAGRPKPLADIQALSWFARKCSRLVPSSERLVYALVHQIFHGIKEHFLVTTELKFNCFLLMPTVDKLPALLRQDLESAFEDELDSIFDVTQLRQSFGQRKRDLEIELKRIKRVKEKFGGINKKLNSLQVRQ